MENIRNNLIEIKDLSPKENEKPLDSLYVQELEKEGERSELEFIESIEEVNGSIDNIPNDSLKEKLRNNCMDISCSILNSTKNLAELSQKEDSIFVKQKAKEIEKDIKKSFDNLDFFKFLKEILNFFWPIFNSLWIDFKTLEEQTNTSESKYHVESESLLENSFIDEQGFIIAEKKMK